MAVMMDEMGIDTGLNIDRLLEIGRMNERIVGRRLRSESVHSGRVPKTPTGRGSPPTL
jgi:hydroxymethylglutaryl-CoA lyase